MTRPILPAPLRVTNPFWPGYGRPTYGNSPPIQRPALGSAHRAGDLASILSETDRHQGCVSSTGGPAALLTRTSKACIGNLGRKTRWGGFPVEVGRRSRDLAQAAPRAHADPEWRGATACGRAGRARSRGRQRPGGERGRCAGPACVQTREAARRACGPHVRAARTLEHALLRAVRK